MYISFGFLSSYPNLKNIYPASTLYKWVLGFKICHGFNFMDKYCQRSNEIRYLMNISSFTIGYGTKCYGMGELIQTRIRTLAPWQELLVSGAGIQTRLTVRYIKEETFTWFYLLSLSFITFTVSKLVCKQIIFLYQAVSHDNKSIN